jgi:peptide/nickel transport system substrate-binding protein
MVISKRIGLALLALALSVSAAATTGAKDFTETPMLAAKVASGELPAVAKRLPERPLIVSFDGKQRTLGKHGGELRTLMSQPRDTRMMVVYGYARLVGYDPSWNLAPDLLEAVDVKEGRDFTLKLRPGHRWSDGFPFTAEDFRFYWEDVAGNPELSGGGHDPFLLVDGKPPRFEVIDETTVRYTWDKPNPFFLPALAGARPEDLYLPAHHLKPLHARYAPAEALQKKVADAGQRNWAALFTQSSHIYQNDRPELPTLQPWILKTQPPSTRFIFVRNPFYHRVDPDGRQLPYIDQIAMSIVSPQLIPAKVAAGDADLQARGLSFENYTILKQGEKRSGYKVHLWRSARGSELALHPNLTATDPEWRALMRRADFRRALSLGVNRKEINQVTFHGLAEEGNDTVLATSPLFKPEYRDRFASFDPDQANRLLDGLELKDGNKDGIREMASGKAIEIVVETAGEDPNQVAILQLIRDSWQKIGVKLLVKPEQREVLRNRAFAGETVMSVWSGVENGLPTAATSPHELAPTSQQQLSWPKWGQHFETQGRTGEGIDLPEAAELLDLNRSWIRSQDAAPRTDIWHRMLALRADNQFTIGTVRGVPQPVVVSNRLLNVPAEGIYNWEPGAHFGIYQPDTFWFAEAAGAGSPSR